MKRYLIVFAIVAAFIAPAFPVSAETVFNEMSGCIKTWGKCGGGSKAATTGVTAPRPTVKTDVIGNKTPTVTDNSGKTQLGM